MADNPDRKMLLVAFLQASNCSNYTGSWRHPETDPGFMDLEFYQNISTTLERGKFHLAFIDDRLAMPSRFGDSFSDAVENGIRVVKLDLVPVITAMPWPPSIWDWVQPIPPPITPLIMWPGCLPRWTTSQKAALPGTW